MKKLNVITGLPRSGSTLLCNILNQNPKFYASSTSILPGFISNASQHLSNSIEFKANLNENKTKEEKRVIKLFENITSAWYYDIKKNVIFDKSRGWLNGIDIFNSYNSEGKIIVLIRDLRNVFASIQKQHLNSGLFNEGSNSIWKRASDNFSENGLVGSCVNGIQNIVRNKYPFVCISNISYADDYLKQIRQYNPKMLFIKYEKLSEDPKIIMKILYEFINEDFYEHNFENIKNTAKDPDGLYLNKFPHEGSGKVVPTNQSEWTQYMSQEIAQEIINLNKWYFDFFEYNLK